jgi:transcriptional regulator with XRE-family HTH domain
MDPVGSVDPSARQVRQDTRAQVKEGASPERSADAELAVLIGTRLKSLRSRAGLSLESLSKLAGVSRGMLSQIELGRSVPTITLLSRIAVAFELPVSAFLTPDTGDAVRVLRSGETELLRSPDGSFVSRALFPFLGARRTEFYEVRLTPGCERQSSAHTAGTIENLVVASGAMVVQVAGTSYLLGPGDSIYFGGDVPHSYQNSGSDTAIAYLVMTYPQPVSY